VIGPGLGVLEQVVIDPYAPGGFTQLLDGAAPRTAPAAPDPA
jgi:hypothetical protein